MRNIDEIENRISELLEEVGHALFPVTREDFDDRHKWLSFLEKTKREKDKNSSVWQKMQRWD